MKIECDMCKKIVSETNIFHLNLSEPHDDNITWTGDEVFDGMVCKKCAKEVLKSFKNKIWVNKKFEKELKNKLKEKC